MTCPLPHHLDEHGQCSTNPRPAPLFGGLIREAQTSLNSRMSAHRDNVCGRQPAAVDRKSGRDGSRSERPVVTTLPQNRYNTSRGARQRTSPVSRSERAGLTEPIRQCGRIAITQRATEPESHHKITRVASLPSRHRLRREQLAQDAVRIGFLRLWLDCYICRHRRLKLRCCQWPTLANER
jgi:hypothetical protein